MNRSFLIRCGRRAGSVRGTAPPRSVDPWRPASPGVGGESRGGTGARGPRVRRREFLAGSLAAIALNALACNLAERTPALPLPNPPLPGAGGAPAGEEPTPPPAAADPPAGTLAAPTPDLPLASAEPPERVVRRFLDAWQARRYAEMYELLSAAARESTTAERFTGRYRAIMDGATVLGIQAEAATVRVLPGGQPGEGAPPQPDAGRPRSATAVAPAAPGSGAGAGQATPAVGTQAEAPIAVTFTTARLGTFREENRLPLVLEADGWKVAWTPSLIFRDLTADTVVRMFPDDPVRGSIYDRQGRPLATQDSTIHVGVIPGDIQDEAALLAALSGYLKQDPAVIKAKYAEAPAEWFVPLKTFPSSQYSDIRQKLGKIPGIEIQERATRIYPQGATLAQTVGFVGEIDDEQLKRLAARGYEAGDPVGRTGVERWGEEILGGERGGRLVIMSPAGAIVRTIAEKPARNGGDLYLTIDIELQRQLEDLLGERPGSIVVLDPRSNEVLALVTFPRFDPNKFISGFSDEEWRKLRDDPRNPFQNRPVASMYPTGSVFKVVTMAAGLERGGFTPDQKFRCRGSWDGLGTGLIMGDWLPGGHGELTYVDGLVQSCDIVYYEIGKKLDSIDHNILPNFARLFGFGEPTGVLGVAEVEGTVPSPEWKKVELQQPWFLGDAVNLSIGQGYLQGTPIQVANAYSAIAMGGSLRTPVLVQKATAHAEKSTASTGGAGREYRAVERRKLPVSEANLRVIHNALKQVASTPKGTAYYAFRGEPIPTAAKTGSAENQNPESHAWFCAYAPADKPEVVIVCMLEGSGAGSEVAAPLGRKVLDLIFSRPRAWA